jgi:hypothetical protein
MQFTLTSGFLDEAAEFNPLSSVLWTFLWVVPARPVFTTSISVFFYTLSIGLPIETALLKLPVVKGDN